MNKAQWPFYIELTKVPPPDRLGDPGTKVSLDVRTIAEFGTTILTPPPSNGQRTVPTPTANVEKIRPKEIKCTEIYSLGKFLYVEETYEVVQEIIHRAHKELEWINR